MFPKRLLKAVSSLLMGHGQCDWAAGKETKHPGAGEIGAGFETLRRVWNPSCHSPFDILALDFWVWPWTCYMILNLRVFRSFCVTWGERDISWRSEGSFSWLLHFRFWKDTALLVLAFLWLSFLVLLLIYSYDFGFWSHTKGLQWPEKVGHLSVSSETAQYLERIMEFSMFMS